VGEKEIPLSSNGSIQILNQKSQIALGRAKITELPRNFLLEQNSPNPFNPSTTINYQLPVDSRVTLKVFDVLGQEVATLVNEDKKAGRYEVEFNGSKLSSGVYFYRLKADGISLIQKMILAR
jgi:beta-lactamase superfamily II metal-dependent hydrolase